MPAFSAKKYRRVFAYPVIACTLFLAAFSAYFFHTLIDLHSVKPLERYAPPVPTQILDIKGRLIAQFYAEKREIANFDEIPPYFIQAVLANEDDYFFYHLGFNPWRMAMALIHNLREMKRAQGGSTITIQLSKLLFLHHRKTIKRKVRELWYAVQLERLYSKKEILLFYFNQIYFGHGCYGVKAAARFFFQKSIENLNVAECALLVGLIKSPKKYSPLRRMRASMARHRLVLRNMTASGAIDPNEIDKHFNDFWVAYASRLQSQRSTVADLEENKAPYFVEHVRSRLEATFGKRAIYHDGLIVHTSLNLDHQKVAQTQLWKQLQKQDRRHDTRYNKVQKYINRYLYDQIDILGQLFNIEGMRISNAKMKKRVNSVLFDQVYHQLSTLSLLSGQDQLFALLKYSDFPSRFDMAEECQGAIVSIDPHTGYITAMVGGSGFSYENQFNRVFLAKRQIGSAIKPFVYAAAIDTRTITAASMIDDVPISFYDEYTGQMYIPRNYTGHFSGKVVARDALRKSINVAALQVLDKTGIEKVRHYASGMFRAKTQKDIQEKFPNNLTMGLGSGLFSPIDAACAYAIFANEGREVVPLSIRYVTDRYGEVIKNFEKQYLSMQRRIIDSGTAYIMKSLLAGVFKPGGTAYRWKQLKDFPHRNHSAGKTGTSSNWKDAWFIGFNKYLVTAIWIGYDSNKSLGKGQAGGKLAAPVWIEFNKQTLKDTSPITFTRPNNVVKRRISRASGLLATAYTQNPYYEYFLSGTEPTTFCTAHGDKKKEESEFIKRYGSKSNPKDKNDKNKTTLQAFMKMLRGK